MLSNPIPGRQRVWEDQRDLEFRIEVSDGVMIARAKHTPRRPAGEYVLTAGREAIGKNFVTAGRRILRMPKRLKEQRSGKRRERGRRRKRNC